MSAENPKVGETWITFGGAAWSRHGRDIPPANDPFWKPALVVGVRREERHPHRQMFDVVFNDAGGKTARSHFRSSLRSRVLVDLSERAKGEK